MEIIDFKKLVSNISNKKDKSELINKIISDKTIDNSSYYQGQLDLLNDILKNPFFRKFQEWIENKKEFYEDEYLEEWGARDGNLTSDYEPSFWTDESLDKAYEYATEKIQEHLENVEFNELMRF